MEKMTSISGKPRKQRRHDVWTKKKLLTDHLGVFVDDGGDPETHTVASSLRLNHYGKILDRVQRNLVICELDRCRAHIGDGTKENAYTVDRLYAFGQKRSLQIVISVFKNRYA